jgi:hypothetical protein
MSDSPTPESSSPAPAADDPYAFTPVPAASSRHDGFTPDRQRAFIAQLARIGVVSAAAKAVGMSAKSAYALRKRAGADSSFAAAWDLAAELGRGQALDLSIERALEGEVIPVFYGGRQIGRKTRYDNRLLIAALRALQHGQDRPHGTPFTAPTTRLDGIAP